MSKRNRNRDDEKTGMSFISVFLSVLILIAIAGFAIFKHYYNMLDTGKKENVFENMPEEIPSVEEIYNDEEETKPEGPAEFEFDMDFEGMYNVLLIGVDTRDDDFSGRSDSMILLTVDKNSKQVVMTSFLRDLYVTIPGYGDNRLNAAHAFGGPELLKETILTNFGIPIDNTIVINFYIIKDFVDAIGGVEVELTADEIVHMNSYITTQSEEFGTSASDDLLPERDGTYHLNGNQSLAYSRVRYVGTDFGRTARQRSILTLAMERVKGMSLFELNDLAVEFLPRLKTDMDEKDCLNFLVSLFMGRGYDTKTFVIPTEDSYVFSTINGMSVITTDFEYNTSTWYNLFTDR